MTETHFTKLRGNSQTVRTGTTHPTSPTPVAGDVYFNTSDSKFYVYDGTYWCGTEAMTTTSTSTS